MKFKIKGTKIFSFLLAMVMAITLVMGTANVDAAKKKPWKKSYTKILNKWKLVEKYSKGDMKYIKQYFGKDYKFNRYFLCDVDKNGTPELFLDSTKMGLTAVFTYKGGKIKYLGCDSYDKVNTKRHALIVNGHWHGSGGSGGNEYTVYKVSGKTMQEAYYMDYDFQNYRVTNKNNKTIGTTKKAYKKYYNKYVKGGKKFGTYKRYKLSNKKGLK